MRMKKTGCSPAFSLARGVRSEQGCMPPSGMTIGVIALFKLQLRGRQEKCRESVTFRKRAPAQQGGDCSVSTWWRGVFSSESLRSYKDVTRAWHQPMNIPRQLLCDSLNPADVSSEAGLFPTCLFVSLCLPQPTGSKGNSVLCHSPATSRPASHMYGSPKASWRDVPSSVILSCLRPVWETQNSTKSSRSWCQERGVPTTNQRLCKTLHCMM